MEFFFCSTGGGLHVRLVPYLHIHGAALILGFALLSREGGPKTIRGTFCRNKSCTAAREAWEGPDGNTDLIALFFVVEVLLLSLWPRKVGFPFHSFHVNLCSYEGDGLVLCKRCSAPTCGVGLGLSWTDVMILGNFACVDGV